MRIALWLGALTYLLVFSAPRSEAQASSPHLTKTNHRPDLMAGADEGVGSLPTVKAPEPPPSVRDLLPPRFLGPLGELRPYISLNGPLDAVMDLVLDARGDGIVTVYPMDGNLNKPTDEWVFGFHGDVVIELKNMGLDQVTVDIQVGNEFSGGAAGACWNGQCTGVVVLSADELELPLLEYVSTGSLYVDKIGIAAVSIQQTTVEYGIELASPRSIRVRQSFD